MNSQSIQHYPLQQLVEQDLSRAYVLHYLGVRFYDRPERTLVQACQPLGLRPEHVVAEWQNPRFGWEAGDVPLGDYPIDLIIQYLKHTHTIFVKHKLPYIGRLVENFRANHSEYEALEKDMKVLYPLFMDDFIHHIYEEEDSLFTYINELERAVRNLPAPGKLYYKLERQSLQQLALEHEVHDDEMAGIRRITRDYKLTEAAPLHIKVLYSELQQFEKALQLHAQVENQILFPKAMTLEAQVRQRVFELARYN